MDEDGREMTTIAIPDENSSSKALIDAFNTNDVSIFCSKLEYTILNESIDVFEEFLIYFSGCELKLNDKNLLHLLVKLLPEIDYQKTSNFVKLALEHGVDINEPDDKNQTPFFYLLKFQPKFPDNKLIEGILENYAVDFHNFKGDKMQQMFIKQNPGKKIPERIESNLTYGFLTSQLNKRNHSKFIEKFPVFKAQNIERISQNGILINLSENNNESLKLYKISEMSEKFQDKCAHFLYAAVKKGAFDVTKLLVDEGINVERVPNSYNNKISPTFLAAFYGYDKVFEYLLKSNPQLKNSNDGNILHTILHASYQNNIKDPRVNHIKCFKLAIEKCGANDVNLLDKNGQTPLHYAVQHRNNEATLELLRRGADITLKNKFGETPLDDMRNEVFEEFLDKRINLVQDPQDKEDKELKIGIDLQFLNNKNKSEVESLQLIANNRELRPLIQHPTLSSFIFLKWSRYSLIFYLNFLIFTILISALIGFIIMCHMGIENGRIFLQVLSILAIILLFFREVFQFSLSCFDYLKSLVNYLEILLIFFAILMQLPESSFENETWIILRALTILISAFEVLHLVGDLPFLAISTNMVILIKVGWNYLKGMLLYAIPIIAFALSFFVLYSGNVDTKDSDEQFNNFITPPVALLKVLVMWLGEFDASNLSFTAKSWVCSLIFMIFVFVVPIVLFNVLSANAVDDLQKIKAKGELTNLIARVKVLARYEKIIDSKFLKIFPCFKKLKTFVSLFPDFLSKDGKLIVAPNKKFAIYREQNSKLESQGCFGSGSQKCLTSCGRLDYKIGKKLRVVIEERKERKIKDECENEMKNMLKGVNEKFEKMEMEIKGIKDLIINLRN